MISFPRSRVGTPQATLRFAALHASRPMKLPVQTPLVGQSTVYEGYYRPHWEIGCILVRVPRWRRLMQTAGVLSLMVGGYCCGFIDGPGLVVLGGPIVLLGAIAPMERWQPGFPADWPGRWTDAGGIIKFEGIVSPRGRFGHLGYLQRTVDISRVIEYDSSSRSQ